MEMKLRAFIIMMLLLFCWTPLVSAQTAERIHALASQALDKGNYSYRDGIVELYGTRTNGPDTRNGKLACAKVVTIILKQAGVVDRFSLAVRNVEAALKEWSTVENPKDLKPGDIVVWVNRFKGRKDQRCTGGGNCHVGILTVNGYFHNSPITNAPTFGGFSLLAFKFKKGYRPPD
jgi:cell wall-associated NlpC family hydrolase